MQNQSVFKCKKEKERLKVQNRLLSAYEEPVFARIFENKANISVLDIGCNDGKKTAARFAAEEVTKVIGIEYNENLAQSAQKKYGGDKFSFCSMDVEEDAFADKLEKLMQERDIESFDVIYLSFVLMHLKNPKKLLEKLQKVLSKEGQVVIIEADDCASVLKPDRGGLLKEFLKMLEQDKYAGNRLLGNRLLELVIDSGFGQCIVWHEGIEAGRKEKEKKKDIFQMFFSYFPEDVELLLKAEPDNEQYQSWSVWLQDNYQKLEKQIIAEESEIFMGIKILSCMKG